MRENRIDARVEVGALTTVKDVHGREYEVRKVSTYHRPTLEEAQAMDPVSDPGRYTDLFVAPAPPYYLGSIRHVRAEDGTETIPRRLDFLDFELLTVSPSRRMDAIIERRQQLLEERGQYEVWWQ